MADGRRMGRNNKKQLLWSIAVHQGLTAGLYGAVCSRILQMVSEKCLELLYESEPLRKWKKLKTDFPELRAAQVKYAQEKKTSTCYQV